MRPLQRCLTRSRPEDLLTISYTARACLLIDCNRLTGDTGGSCHNRIFDQDDNQRLDGETKVDLADVSEKTKAIALEALTTQDSDSFEYKALDANKKEIRLLDIAPGLLNAPVRASICHESLLSNPAPQFETVSYVWGDSSQRGTIILNGCIFDVPRSSEEVLRNLRLQTEQKTLWIDAICMNQADIEERTRQVALMGDIYSQSLCTLAWIGHANEKTDLAFRYVDDLVAEMTRETDNLSQLHSHVNRDDNKHLNHADHKSTLSEETWTALYSLYDRNFFKRVWIIQEMALPPECLCVCGPYARPMVNLLRVSVWLRYKYHAHHGHEIMKPATSMFDYADHRFGLAVFESQMSSRFSVLLQRFGEYLASDCRDKVFGLLGLWKSIVGAPEIPQLLYPDYNKSVRDVLRDAVLFAIQDRRGLRVLRNVCYTNSTFAETLASEWPTWVHRFDLSNDPKEDAQVLSLGIGDTGRKSNDSFNLLAELKDANTIGVYGTALDKVETVHTIDATKISRSKFYDFVEAHASSFIAGSRYSSTLDRRCCIARTLCTGATADSTCACEKCLPNYRDYFSSALETCKEVERHPKTRQCWSQASLYSYNRVLFATPDFIGLGPLIIKPGDIVCLMRGAIHPFVLRPCDDEYYFLGECYVDGIIHSQIYEDLEADKLDMDKFYIR